MALSNALFPGLKAYAQEIAQAEVCAAQVIAMCGPLTYWLTGSSWFAATISPFYFFADMFFVQQNEYLFHHALITVIALSYNLLPLSPVLDTLLSSTIIGMEISTIFVNIMTMDRYKMIQLHPTVLLTNNLLFIATFFKFRVWNGTLLWFNPALWEPASISFAPLYCALVGLYCLNLYWAQLIAQKASRLLCGRSSRVKKSEDAPQEECTANPPS